MSNHVEETTVVTDGEPSRVVKTTKVVDPVVIKTIFHFNKVIMYALGVIEVLLAFRFVLKALGANPASGFTNFIYSLTELFVAPFYGIIGASINGSVVLEWATIISAFVFFFIAWGIVYLLDLFYPITPKDVETTVI